MRSDVVDPPARAKPGGEPSVKFGQKINERRLTERVRKKWEGAARGALPLLSEIEILMSGDDKPFCFIIDLRLSDILPYFSFMGDALTAYSTLYPMGDPRREKTLLDAAMAKMDEAALSRAPVEFSEIKKLDNGRRVAFRTILLPVSEDGVDVTHIYGAAKGKRL